MPPLPVTLGGLKIRITTVVEAVDTDMLSKVWDEFEYRIDNCRHPQGGHIEHFRVFRMPHHFKTVEFKVIRLQEPREENSNKF